MVKARCYGFTGTLVSQLMCLYIQALTGSCCDRVLGVCDSGVIRSEMFSLA